MSQLYARVFLQILDSSLAEDYQTRHIFEDILKLVNRDGVCDMTRQAIARRTNIPLEVVNSAIEKLESPDPHSRDSDHDGRRLVRLDDHRDWGWRVVNWLRYDAIRTSIEQREHNANRMARYRASKRQPPSPAPHTPKTQKQPQPQIQIQGIADSEPTCSLHVGNKWQNSEQPSSELPLDDGTHAGTPQNESGSEDHAPTPKVAGEGRTGPSRTILEHLNTRAGRSFRPSDQYLKAIDARLAEVKGDVAGVLAMIDRQVALWAHDPQMAECLNPVTLFRPSKFPRYYDDRNRPITAPGSRNGCAGARPHRNDFVGTPESRAAWAAQCAAADERLVEGF